MKFSVIRDEKLNFLIKLDVAVFGMLDNSEILNVWHSQRLNQFCLLTQNLRKQQQRAYEPMKVKWKFSTRNSRKMSQFTREQRVRQRFMPNARAEASCVIVLAITNKEHNLIIH